MNFGIVFSKRKKLVERIETLETELSQLRMEVNLERENKKVENIDNQLILSNIEKQLMETIKEKNLSVSQEVVKIYEILKNNNDELYNYIENQIQKNTKFFMEQVQKMDDKDSGLSQELFKLYETIKQNNDELYSFIEKQDLELKNYSINLTDEVKKDVSSLSKEIEKIYKLLKDNNDDIYQFIIKMYRDSQDELVNKIRNNIKNMESAPLNKEQWQVMFSYDNMLSDLQLSLIEQLIPGNRKRLEQLKDTHLGETCFVIGNGPSLTAADLTKLKDMEMFTFASKRINVIFDQTDWRPDIWAASDLPYIEMYQDEISNLSGFPKLIPAQAILKRGIQIKDAIYFPFLQSERNPQWFNYDILKGVHFWGTITCKLINLAVYMGFKEIYLLGVDNTYPLKLGEDGKYQIDETKQDHFSKDYATKEQKKVLNKDIDDMAHAMEYVQSSFKTVKWFCDQKDIKIYNATRGGKLEVFPRVAMDEIKS